MTQLHFNVSYISLGIVILYYWTECEKYSTGVSDILMATVHHKFEFGLLKFVPMAVRGNYMFRSPVLLLTDA